MTEDAKTTTAADDAGKEDIRKKEDIPNKEDIRKKEDIRNNRSRYFKFSVALAIGIALLSFGLAIYHQWTGETHDQLGKWLIAFWGFIPHSIDGGMARPSAVAAMTIGDAKTTTAADEAEKEKEAIRQTRSRLFAISVVLAIGIALLSFGLAIYHQWTGETHDQLGKWLIAFWGFIPPLVFWGDWVYFCSHLDTAEQNVAKQSYDLSRNIWIAFVAILTFLFFPARPPPPGTPPK
jgi:hypothetical protein